MSLSRNPTVCRLIKALTLCLLFRSLLSFGQIGGAVEQHQYDSINLATLQVSVNAPIYSAGGPLPESGAFTSNFGLTELSTGYWGTLNGAFPTGELTAGFSPEWSTLPASISYTSTSPNNFCYYASNGTPMYSTRYFNPLLTDSLGRTHALNGNLYIYQPQYPGTPCVNSTASASVIDGTGWFFNEGTGTFTDKHGDQYVENAGNNYMSTETDPNGNVASLATQSLGQPFLTSISNGGYQYNDASGNVRQVTLSLMTATGRTNFGCSYPLDQSIANSHFVTAVNFPDSTSLGITYEGTAGYAGDYTGRISQLTLPTGGTISYQYLGGNAPGPGTGVWCSNTSLVLPSIVPELTRTTSEGTWIYLSNYTLYSNSNASVVTTVTDPSGNNVVHTFFADNPYVFQPVEVQKQVYQGSVSPSNLLATYTYCYNNLTTFANCANPTASTINYPTPSITEEDEYVTIPGVTGSSETATSYDSYGNVTGVKQYDFGASAPTLIRTITYGSYSSGACNAVGSNIFDRPCEITASDGTHASSDTRFTYDSKGNALMVTSLVSGTPTAGTWLKSSITHNSNGTVNTLSDAAGMVTTFGYNGTGGCNSSLPTSIAVGSATTTYFTTYATYDCVGGKVLTTTDANSNKTTASYTANGADPFYALKSAAGPLADTVGFTYTPTSAQSTMSFGSATETSYSYVDALGRVSEGQSLHGSNYDTVNQTYGWGTASNGAPVPYGAFGTMTSVPCSVALAAPCPGSTPVTTTYMDALGRTSSVVDAGGGMVNYSYTDQDVIAQLGPAPAGENVKKVQTEYDGLGRVKSVCQILSSGGSSCGQAAGGNGYVTTYTYALSAGGSQVVATKGIQSHTSALDGLGRLVSNTTPEKGTIQYIYDTQTSACGNSTSYGDLVETIDNAGNTVCYTFDVLHRVTGVSVAGQTSNCIGYLYGDQPLGGATPPTGWPASASNGNGRVVAAWTNSACNGRSSLVTDEWFSYDAEGKTTDMWESTPHSGGYYHTTVGYLANEVPSSLSGIPGYTAITYGVDPNGNPNTAAEGSTNIVSGVTYSTEGAPLTVSMGNSGGDTSNYGYDPNTGRMTNWTFTVGSSPLSQTGTLNWSPNGTLRQLLIADGFNAGGTQTCNFGTSSTMGYDDLGRLLSDNCGPIWSQTFSYDQYDNLTQTGSVSWACTACYNSANNQYNNILSGSIAYDSNGRLTDDTFQKYVWNGYGQMSGTVGTTSGNINCGSNGFCYTYDALGQMVELSQGSAYHEILYSPLGKTATMTAQVTSSSYMPLPGGGTLFSTGSSGNNRFYQHKDWLGSARVESNISARTVTYDRAFAPYGEMYDNFGVTTQLNFTGDTQDFDSSSMLFDTPNRELHTGQGRWISPDPSGVGWNGYGYPTDPNSEIDPSGLDPQQQQPSPAATGCWLCWFFGNGSAPPPPPTPPAPPSGLMPPLLGMSTDDMHGGLAWMAGNFGPSIYGKTNGHAPGWVLQSANHIKLTGSAGSIRRFFGSTLPNSERDFFLGEVQELDKTALFVPNFIFKSLGEKEVNVQLVPDTSSAGQIGSYAGMIGTFFVGGEENEAASLASRWSTGTFEGTMAQARNIFYHWMEHGEEVEASSVEQYLRRAASFADNHKGATRIELTHGLGVGVVEFRRGTRFIILDAAGKIVSFGARGGGI
jgi:RHS repeat-associated protein